MPAIYCPLLNLASNDKKTYWLLGGFGEVFNSVINFKICRIFTSLETGLC